MCVGLCEPEQCVNLGTVSKALDGLELAKLCGSVSLQWYLRGAGPGAEARHLEVGR